MHRQVRAGGCSGRGAGRGRALPSADTGHIATCREPGGPLGALVPWDSALCPSERFISRGKRDPAFFLVAAPAGAFAEHQPLLGFVNKNIEMKFIEAGLHL